MPSDGCCLSFSMNSLALDGREGHHCKTTIGRILVLKERVCQNDGEYHIQYSIFFQLLKILGHRRCSLAITGSVIEIIIQYRKAYI